MTGFDVSMEKVAFVAAANVSAVIPVGRAYGGAGGSRHGGCGGASAADGMGSL